MYNTCTFIFIFLLMYGSVCYIMANTNSKIKLDTFSHNFVVRTIILYFKKELKYLPNNSRKCH